MSPPNLTPLLLFTLITIVPSTSCSPLSTVAISHIFNKTLVCALLRSPTSPGKFDLNCTSFPNGTTHNYPAGVDPYSAIAAGDGFLCALTSPFPSKISTMKWWDFSHVARSKSLPDAKRVYIGPSLSSLSAGDSHVCGLTGGSGSLDCWRWPQLDVPPSLKPAEVAVGGGFVCALSGAGAIRCFSGGGGVGVVGHEPDGTFVAIAAGRSHACAIKTESGLVCWGVGAPEIAENVVTGVDLMALGNERTCVLYRNGTVRCWGEGSELPEDLAAALFVSIQARGDAFCGVLMVNYSLVCWGSEHFRGNHLVFKEVLPGACAASCRCLPLAGSGNICGNGALVCRPCPLKINTSPNPNSSPNSTTTTPTVYLQSSSAGKRRRLILIILCSVGFVIGLIAAALFLFHKFRRANGRIHDTDRLRRPTLGRPAAPPVPDPNMGHSTTVEEFPIKLLLAITDGFSDEHKIGSGSFGSVYRAILDDGRTVAIKRSEPSSSASTSRARTPNAGDNRRQDKEFAFWAELGLLSRVNHKNLVRLFGYCKQGPERILVYECMTNGTLHDLLHKSDQQVGLPLGSWAARIRVALDAARGIEYLHTYAVPPIIHRDIKSSNILLDEVWTAKVADFGLSLMHPIASHDDNGSNGTNVSPSAAGTVGYMDPEYYRLQHLTAKSDVYSFGVVLLEILSGCKVIQRYEGSSTPKNVVEFAVPHIVADDLHRVLDPRIAPPTPSEIEAVAYVGYLAADCVSPEGRDRPTMTEIVNGLERALVAISGPSSISRSSTSRSRSLDLIGP